MTDVIDLDAPSTWPSSAHIHAEDWASTLEGTTDTTSDLPVDDQFPPLDELLDGRPIRVYHCTRLLDHEFEDIRANGLAVLDGQLIDRRIRDAHEAGYLSVDEQEQLRGTAIRNDGAGVRLGQVCAVIGQQAFDTHAHQLRPLLETWGGEAIYRNVTDESVRSRIETIGRPSIVVLRLRLTDPDAPRHFASPDLHKLFVGAHLDLEGAHAAIHYNGAIPATDIDEIWQPGHQMYDRYPDLPR